MGRAQMDERGVCVTAGGCDALFICVWQLVRRALQGKAG